MTPKEMMRAWILVVLLFLAIMWSIAGAVYLNRYLQFDHVHDHQHPAHDHAHKHPPHKHPHDWPKHYHPHTHEVGQSERG